MSVQSLLVWQRGPHKLAHMVDLFTYDADNDGKEGMAKLADALPQLAKLTALHLHGTAGMSVVCCSDVVPLRCVRQTMARDQLPCCNWRQLRFQS